MAKTKKKISKNKKQMVMQIIAFSLIAVTLLSTVAGLGTSLFNSPGYTEEHVHYLDADGNTVHLEDIIQNPSSNVYYTEDGREITVDEIIEENGIQFYDPEGNPVDFHNHTESDDSIMIDLSGTEEIAENEEVDNIE